MFHFVTRHVPLTGHYFFTFLSDQGRVLITSKKYMSKESCIAGINDLKNHILNAKIIEGDIQSNA